MRVVVVVVVVGCKSEFMLLKVTQLLIAVVGAGKGVKGREETKELL